jgi:hypothetical protein
MDGTPQARNGTGDRLPNSALEEAGGHAPPVSRSSRVQCRRGSIRLAPALLLLTVWAAVGCDGFKRFDATAGLLTRFNVDTIERDGQQLIRMHSRAARVLIDPVGGRVVSFQRHARPGAFIGSTQPGSIGPNAFEPEPWHLALTVEGEALEPIRDWTVGSGTARLTLLSDAQYGLRIRRAYTLHDTGVLDVEVMLWNTTFQPLPITAESVFPEAEVVKKDGYTRHLRFERQWLSRRLVDGPPEMGGDFRLGERYLKPMKRLRWTERWWITPIEETGEGEVEPPPAEPPPSPRPP